MRGRRLAPLAGAGKPADYDAILPVVRARRGGNFLAARREKILRRQGPATGDDTPAHAYQTCVDVASLAPNAEVTVYPWKEPPELKARTINRVRTFLKVHQPAAAMAS